MMGSQSKYSKVWSLEELVDVMCVCILLYYCSYSLQLYVHLHVQFMLIAIINGNTLIFIVQFIVILISLFPVYSYYSYFI